MLKYRYKHYLPSIRKQALNMATNGSGIGDTSPALWVSRGTTTKSQFIELRCYSETSSRISSSESSDIHFSPLATVNSANSFLL